MKKYDPLKTIDSFYHNTNLTAEQSNIVYKLSLDTNVEVRLRVCELLGGFPSEYHEKILLGLINDDDYIVRASACDSLSWSRSPLVLDALSDAMQDSVNLVRGYAVLSFADVQRNISSNCKESISFLESFLIKEKNSWVRISIYRSLLLLGETKYLNEFLLQAYDKKYENRCFFLNLLEELVSNKIIEISDDLFKQLQQMYENEETLAVKSRLNDLILKYKT